MGEDMVRIELSDRASSEVTEGGVIEVRNVCYHASLRVPYRLLSASVIRGFDAL